MTELNYHHAADLFLGSDRQTAFRQGARRFRSVAKALRFALEEAAPVSLRGAMLVTNGASLERSEMIRAYQAEHYPLDRKP